MKATIKASMKALLLHYFAEFANDPENKDAEVQAGYADSFTDDMERYLRAYNDFKED